MMNRLMTQGTAKSLFGAVLLTAGSSLAYAAEVYVGVRGGAGIVEQTSAGLTQQLRNGNADLNVNPEPGVAANLDQTIGAFTGYVGLDFGGAAIELGFLGFEENDVRISGTTSTPNNLANAVARLDVPRAGEGVTLSYKIDLPITERWEGRVKMGAYFWEHDFDVVFQGNVVGTAEDDGTDIIAGVGFWYTGLGAADIGFDFDFANINDDTVFLMTGGVEFGTGWHW